MSLAYKILLLLHLATVIVGFGSAFVYPLLRARARRLPPGEAYAINHATFAITAPLSTYPTIAAGIFGIGLIGASDELYKFSQTWVSIALLLWLLVSYLLPD